MANAPNDNQERSFEEAVWQFLDARLRGAAPDVEELVRKYPEFEDRIRRKVDEFQKVNSLFDSLVQAEALLKWDKEAGDFLDPPDADPNVTIQTSAVPDASGIIIGRYKLLEKIGEGGMATVYMAEQKQPIRRRVALKLIKLGMDSKQVIARFEAERQALAIMDHPNIAKVFDAGAPNAVPLASVDL